MTKLRSLDLFTGIGGMTLGLQDWCHPVAYCEKEAYCQAVLLDRMKDNEIPTAPIYKDITALTGQQLAAAGITNIDLICGGFPCQDISVAGTGKGLAGQRSGLFYEVCRLVKEIKPSFVFLENVPAIRTRGLREVIRSLTDLGYDCRWTRVSAAEVGAPHLRERWFLLGRRISMPDSYRQHDKSQTSGVRDTQGKTGEQERRGRLDGMGAEICNPDGTQYSQVRGVPRGQNPEASRNSQWATEPNVGRVVDGTPFRVDRIKALGNAVVPAQAKEAFQRLVGLE